MSLIAGTLSVYNAQGAPPEVFTSIKECYHYVSDRRSAASGSLLWVDVCSISFDVRKEVWRSFAEFMPSMTADMVEKLIDPCSTDVIELVDSSQCVYGAVSCMQLADVDTFSERDSFPATPNRECWCSFITNKEILITFREHLFAGWREMRHSLVSTGSTLVTTAALLAKLLYFTSEARIQDPTSLLGEVDCIDEMVLLIAPGDQDQPDLLRRIALLRRRISGDRNSLYLKEKLLHTYLTSSIRAALIDDRHEDRQVTDEVRQSLVRISQIADRLDDARDTLNQANLNFVTGVSMRMSQSSANMDFKMQILGQVATICLPLNLVASIFGMNCTVPFQTGEHNSLTAFWGILGIMFVWCVICSIPTLRSLSQGNPAAAIVPSD